MKFDGYLQKHSKILNMLVDKTSNFVEIKKSTIMFNHNHKGTEQNKQKKQRTFLLRLQISSSFKIKLISL